MIKRSKSQSTECGQINNSRFDSQTILYKTKYQCDSTMKISKFRQKSTEGQIFGQENYSKKWMQQIKVEIPQHRNQKLGKIIFDKLKGLVPKTKYKKVLKSLKDHAKVVKILISMRPRQETIKLIENKRCSMKPLPNFIIQKTKPQKPQLKLFPFNKTMIIPEPLFRRGQRNKSQEGISPVKLYQSESPEKLQPSTSQKRLSLQIKNIYGVKLFQHN